MYDTSPGQRFRLEQWEPLLKDEGIEITYAPFETAELREVLYKSGGTVEKIKSVIGGLRRRQAPPGVKITPRAFGRDRRLPIVNRYRSY